MSTYEDWRPLPSAPNYEISPLGLVRGPGRWGRMKELRPANNGHGYLHLTIDGVQRYVHRLVAEAYLGNPPSDKVFVNHIDGNKGNNAAENLEWVDRIGNAQHAKGMGLLARGEKHGRAKLTLDQVREIRRLRGAVTGVAVARMFGISRAQVSRIQTGKKWAHYEDYLHPQVI